MYLNNPHKNQNKVKLNQQKTIPTKKAKTIQKLNHNIIKYKKVQKTIILKDNYHRIKNILMLNKIYLLQMNNKKLSKKSTIYYYNKLNFQKIKCLKIKKINHNYKII